MSMHNGSVAIVGASETAEVGVLPHCSALQLHVDAARRAMADAGVQPAEIDGFATASGQGEWLGLEVPQQLGIEPAWVDTTAVGGCSFMLHVRHAAAAIAAGAATTVLITHGESGRSRIGMSSPPVNMSSPTGQFEAPYGAITAYSLLTVPALRFLHDRGMGAEDLAEVVVAQRQWSAGNPRAALPDPITVDAVLSSPMVAYPFTKSMCCLVTDGGGAVVLTSAERARDLATPHRAVFLLGSGEAVETPTVAQMADLGSSAAFRRAAERAFATAGLRPGDIDHVMFYDAFAHLPLYMLEDAGFVGRGQSGAFVSEGHTGIGGQLPMNTSGGGLSYTHTGQYGMFAILESVRQLRREAYRQVDTIETSFVLGNGGYFWAGGALIFSSKEP
jgi:acetyl-CoA acetyltransferase